MKNSESPAVTKEMCQRMEAHAEELTKQLAQERAERDSLIQAQMKAELERQLAAERKAHEARMAAREAKWVSLQCCDLVLQACEQLEHAKMENRALAEEGLQHLHQILLAEKVMEDQALKGEERMSFRETYVRPLWRVLYRWGTTCLLKVYDGTLIKRAVLYLLDHYTQMTEYLKVPEAGLLRDFGGGTPPEEKQP